MPAISSTASGKIILFGEHSVVYGHPAIAVPVTEVKARAIIRAAPRSPSGEIFVDAPDINLGSSYHDLPQNHPLAAAIRLVKSALSISNPPACQIRITSTIPIAAGLGSGTAVSVALIRSLSAFLGRPLPDEQVSVLAFEVDKIHHANPSGIDNTVITYAKPVYFVRDEAIQIINVAVPFTILIADTGIPSPTSVTVKDLNMRWEADPQRYNIIFFSVEEIVISARTAFETGEPNELGLLMTRNHDLLRDLDVSSPELDNLVKSALHVGALGAKMSGGGRGGNMIALPNQKDIVTLSTNLMNAGAVRVIRSNLPAAK
jgi:mevalonate kinase